MKVHLDDIIFKLQKYGGVTEYWQELTSRLCMINGLEITRSMGSKFSRSFPLVSNADIFHSSHFRSCLSRKTKIVSTVHDLNYELGYVESSVLGIQLNKYERERSYKQASALVCISENTKFELLSVYPNLQDYAKLHVIYHGCNRTKPDPSLAAELKSRPPYILFVGGRKGYKNFRKFIEAFRGSSCFANGFQVLCTGAQFDKDEQQFISSLGLSAYVHVVGNVGRAQLGALYENAFCLAYPSIREGFGMPLIEAMQYHCPILAIKTSCIPEIVGNAAMLLEDDSTDEFHFALHALFDENTRNKLITAGSLRSLDFSWDRCARAHLDVYREVIS